MSNDSVQFVQFKTNADESCKLGVLISGTIRDLSSHVPWSNMMEVLEDWEKVKALFQTLNLTELPEAEKGELIAPITYPRKIYCAGANYFSHAAEMETSVPRSSADPFFFLKTPTTTIVGPDSDIHIHNISDAKVDWEAELAVVIGRRGSHISESHAMDFVAGYTIANDISARGKIARAESVAPVFDWDWVSAKNLDDSCPIGPGVVPSWVIDDPQNLQIQLTVNGEIQQDGSTSDMVIAIPELIAAASRISTLEPGDLILTGTPAGVGAPHGTFLKHGDEIQITIEKIGSIVHRVWDQAPASLTKLGR